MSILRCPFYATPRYTRKSYVSRAMLMMAIAALLLSGAATPVAGQQISSTQIAGGSGGRSFTDTLPSAGARVAEVRIRAGDTVDSMQIVYALADGQTVVGARHGGSGGRDNVFRLDADEYITGLSGRHGDTIDSLRIHTNKRVSDVFGGRGGDRDYKIEVPYGNEAVGFTGRAGDLLDGVGLTYARIRSTRRWGVFSGNRPPSAPPTQSSRSGRSSAPATGAGAQSQAIPTAIAGGRGGSTFADAGIAQNARVLAIRVRASYRVESVQAVYLFSNGQSVDGNRHGGSGGRESVFLLDPDEYIVALSGRHGDTIDSLRIHTNKRTSEVFGGSGGSRDFRIEVPAGNQAVGFSGRAGDSLDAIGLVYSAVTPSRILLPWQRQH